MNGGHTNLDTSLAESENGEGKWIPSRLVGMGSRSSLRTSNFFRCGQ